MNGSRSLESSARKLNHDLSILDLAKGICEELNKEFPLTTWCVRLGANYPVIFTGAAMEYMNLYFYETHVSTATGIGEFEYANPEFPQNLYDGIQAFTKAGLPLCKKYLK